jgi:cell division protein FtsZ
MHEVNRLMSEIQERTKCSQVLFGASIDPALAKRISITLIASHLENDPAFLSDEPKRVGNGSRISTEIETFREEPPTRTPSRFVPPPPELDDEKREKIINKQIRIGKAGKKSSGWRQAQLPLDIVSRGRFEKSEPTIHQGADLDVPTYIRLGVPLN